MEIKDIHQQFNSHKVKTECADTRMVIIFTSMELVIRFLRPVRGREAHYSRVMDFCDLDNFNSQALADTLDNAHACFINLEKKEKE